MTFLSITLVSMALLHSDTPDTKSPIQFSYWAAQATQENRKEPLFDPELNDIRKAVADLPFDTYHAIKTGKSEIKLLEDKEFPLDAQYGLHVMPMEKDANNRIKVDMRIMETSKAGKERTALAPSIMMQPDKMVKMRGLKLTGGGELVLVVKAQ
ncbi:MAG: hypothetical protein HYV27_10950 [Candidatus Hydrogenedentes bacterium]|nr:hypothetical protein [Candidatus Hydrogenedentota bacterium]